MSSKKNNLRVLLLQIREHAQVRQEEIDSFVAFSGMHASQWEVHNVFDEPDFGPDIADNFDALFVGGASEASVLEPEKYSFVEPGMALLRHCADAGKPVFASCFGFQLAVLAMGGEVFRDDEEYEMGTLPIRLTPAAINDPLFHDTPNRFDAVSVHKERSTSLPANCELLAETDLCAHAFRIREKPFLGFSVSP